MQAQALTLPCMGFPTRNATKTTVEIFAPGNEVAGLFYINPVESLQQWKAADRAVRKSVPQKSSAQVRKTLHNNTTPHLCLILQDISKCLCSDVINGTPPKHRRGREQKIAPGTEGRAYRVSISPHSSPAKDPSSFCNPAMSAVLSVKKLRVLQSFNVNHMTARWFSNGILRSEATLYWEVHIDWTTEEENNHNPVWNSLVSTKTLHLQRVHQSALMKTSPVKEKNANLRIKDTGSNFISIHCIKPVKEGQNLYST